MVGNEGVWIFSAVTVGKKLMYILYGRREMRYMYMREGDPLPAELEGIGVALLVFDM